jgi:hypothetical protein
MTDDKIKSSIELKKRLVLSSAGDIIPASEDKQDIEIAEFCKWQFDNTSIPFNDLLDNFLDGMVYGFKVGEIIWENEETAAEKLIIVPPEYMGKWWVGNIKHKHSLFFDFQYDTFGNVEALLIGKNYGWDVSKGGKGYIDGEELKNKFLLFIYPYPKDGNYYGDSDLKEIYTQWYAKFQIFRFRNMYLEKFGMPIPEAVYDVSKMKANEVTELKDLMKNFQDSMYLITPGYWNADAKAMIPKIDFKLHEVKRGNATSQYEDAINQIDKQIARKLLIPDKMGFSESGGGSYNLAEVQYDIFVKVIEDLQRKLENLIDGLIKKIVNINYVNVKDYPTWQFDKLSEKVKREMLEVLIDTGVIDSREKWIRKYVGIPEIDEKEQDELDKKEQEKPKNQQPEDDFEDEPSKKGEKPKEFKKKRYLI